MANPSIEVHPEATAEAQAAAEWYAQRSAIAARAFTSELSACVERIAEAPERWPRDRKGTRRYLFPHFPFSLVYRGRTTGIEIIAVAHHRRRPGYWRSR